MNPQRISFARSLPILAFLLSCVIIVIPATMAQLNPKTAGAANIASYSTQAINLPGSFIDFTIDKLTDTPSQGWAPRGTYSLTWRAIAFPIFCLPFWWFAGLGLDALFGRHWIRWWTCLAGSCLCLLSLLFFSVMAVGSRSIEPQRVMAALCGLAFWTLLLSPFPLTTLRQWLTLRRTKASLEARLFARLQ